MIYSIWRGIMAADAIQITVTSAPAVRAAGKQKCKMSAKGRVRAKPARRGGNDSMDGNGRSERI
jgi:hypothetical protein